LVTNLASFSTGAGITSAQYQSLAELNTDVDPTDEDNLTASAFASATRQLTPRFGVEGSAELVKQTFDNIIDESDSVVVTGTLNFQLNRSFSVELGAATSRSEGINTRNNVGDTPEFETIENRVFLRLEWAPPSRASKEPVVSLRQLLR